MGKSSAYQLNLLFSKFCFFTLYLLSLCDFLCTKEFPCGIGEFQFDFKTQESRRGHIRHSSLRIVQTVSPPQLCFLNRHSDRNLIVRLFWYRLSYLAWNGLGLKWDPIVPGFFFQKTLIILWSYVSVLNLSQRLLISVGTWFWSVVFFFWLKDENTKHV